MKRKIEIKDLKDFFATLGLKWTGRYFDVLHIDSDLNGKVAQSFEEIEKCSNSNGPVCFYFKGKDETLTRLFYVRKDKFQEFTEESEIYGGSQLYRGKDYADQWAQFQTERGIDRNPPANKELC